MKNQFKTLIVLTFVILSCSTDKLKVDVSNIEVEIQFDRFEDKMFDVKSMSELYAVNKELATVGGELYDFYIYNMLGMQRVNKDSVIDYLYRFTQDSIMRSLKSDIDVVFKDFSAEKGLIVDLFKHLKYHLPEAPIPNQVITYNSAFNYGVVSTSNRIGLGLDMYTGPENRKIRLAGFPVYMSDKMQPQYLPVDIANSWLVDNVFKESRGENFLEDLIYFGKIHYAIRALLPDLPENLILRYSEQEMEFAMASEYSIWQYLVDKEWIYSTDMKVNLRFFEEAPSTVGLDGSPGRLGRFIGWRMVESYMEKNPDVTLADLLAEENITKVLKAYKPKSNE
ncbi:gliding motility lipoprotein GldB [Crocinitomix catalasitica]|uniref:gliding motility lipoprotein GldB n=1 Tax=Crocinitomix catalasitica TaxID=184607 RepID=UPI00047FF2C7|nr:hypothetical protein [Crocinitomix catalasitica]